MTGNDALANAMKQLQAGNFDELGKMLTQMEQRVSGHVQRGGGI